MSEGPFMNLQFGPWLMTQVSSGKYPGLEWIDGDKKTMFKIPWTKVNYPMWEEHHRIFQAWAIHRSRCLSDSARTTQSFSQIKSNFRTILRKCVEIEEVEDAHQLGLQMGNYKVYRILSREESIAKRRSQQRTRKTYKWLKHLEADFGPDATEGKYRRKNKKLKSFQTDKSELSSEDEPMKTTRTISTQTSQNEATVTSLMLEAATFQEVPDMEVSSPPDSFMSLHSSVSTQFEPQHVEVEVIAEKESEEIALSEEEEEKYIHVPPVKKLSKTMDGFQMLLEAAQLAEDRSKPQSLSNGSHNPCKIRSLSLTDLLSELKIPAGELFTYELSVKYDTNLVMDNVILNHMDNGYRIHYGNHAEQRNLIQLHHPEREDLIQAFDRTPITLPYSSSTAVNSTHTVLQNCDAGLVFKSDNQYTLSSKRLCMSRVYAFTAYGDTNNDTEPMLMPRGRDVVLFSYQKFLQDYRRFLLKGSPKPRHEINLAFGKKTKHRHSRAFVAITLVPKAAETMLQKITEESTDPSVNTILNLLKQESV